MLFQASSVSRLFLSFKKAQKLRLLSQSVHYMPAQIVLFHCCRLPTFSPNKAKGTTMEIKTLGRGNIKKDFFVVAVERAVRGWPSEIWCLHSLAPFSATTKVSEIKQWTSRKKLSSTNKKWNDEGLKVQSPGGSDKDEIGRENGKRNLWGCEFCFCWRVSLSRWKKVWFDGQNVNLISEDARHPRRVILGCCDLLLGHP